MDPRDASRRPDALEAGFRGDEHLLIDPTGHVYNAYTRERLGALTKDG